MKLFTICIWTVSGIFAMNLTLDSMLSDLQLGTRAQDLRTIEVGDRITYATDVLNSSVIVIRIN